MILKFLKHLPNYIKQAYKRPNPLRFLVSQCLLVTNIGRFITFRVQDFRLRFYPSALSATLWESPNDRHEDDTIIRNLLKKGDTFIDVGANIGSLSIAAALTVGQEGHVLAVEPHPRIFTYLTGNLALNTIQNCRAVNVALGDTIGTVRFSDRRFTDDQNSIGHAQNQPQGIDVPLELLDNLTHELPLINLLKVDVEGYELLVLKGAAQTLAKTQYILFESFEPTFQQNGYSCTDLFKLIQSHNFGIYQQNGDKWLPIPEGYMSKNVENLLAKHLTNNA